MGFNIDELVEERRYGQVPKGWYPACIYKAELLNSRQNKDSRYVKVDFELAVREHRHILVPGFFSVWKDNGTDRVMPSKELATMARRAEVSGQFDTMTEFLQALRGRYLMINVVHKYRDKRRIEKAVGFKMMSDSFEPEILPHREYEDLGKENDFL